MSLYLSNDIQCKVSKNQSDKSYPYERLTTNSNLLVFFGDWLLDWEYKLYILDLKFGFKTPVTRNIPIYAFSD